MCNRGARQVLQVNPSSIANVPKINLKKKLLNLQRENLSRLKAMETPEQTSVYSSVCSVFNRLGNGENDLKT